MVGRTVAGGHGRGHALNQLHLPFGFDIGDDGSLVIADTENHRIVRWKPGATEGELIAGGKGRGDRTDQLNEPVAVLIDRMNDCLIISEQGNHRVMRWLKDAEEGEMIMGGNGGGSQDNQLYQPTSMSLDKHGNLYVVDRNNNRIQRFDLR